MSIASKLSQLAEIKSDLRDAITEKTGVDAGDGMGTYAAKILSINTDEALVLTNEAKTVRITADRNVVTELGRTYTVTGSVTSAGHEYSAVEDTEGNTSSSRKSMMCYVRGVEIARNSTEDDVGRHTLKVRCEYMTNRAQYVPFYLPIGTDGSESVDFSVSSSGAFTLSHLASGTNRVQIQKVNGTNEAKFVVVNEAAAGDGFEFSFHLVFDNVYGHAYTEDGYGDYLEVKVVLSRSTLKNALFSKTEQLVVDTDVSSMLAEKVTAVFSHKECSFRDNSWNKDVSFQLYAIDGDDVTISASCGGKSVQKTTFSVDEGESVTILSGIGSSSISLLCDRYNGYYGIGLSASDRIYFDSTMSVVDSMTSTSLSYKVSDAYATDTAPKSAALTDDAEDEILYDAASMISTAESDLNTAVKTVADHRKRYTIETPTTNRTTLDGVEYRTVAVSDFATSTITATDSTPWIVYLPAPVVDDEGRAMCRDFILKVKVTAETPPSITFVRSPDDSGVAFEAADEDWATLAHGINFFSFTESER